MSMEAFYKMIFEVRYFCKLSIPEIESMYPFERDAFMHHWQLQKEQEKEQNKDGGGGLAQLIAMAS